MKKCILLLLLSMALPNLVVFGQTITNRPWFTKFFLFMKCDESERRQSSSEQLRNFMVHHNTTAEQLAPEVEKFVIDNLDKIRADVVPGAFDTHLIAGSIGILGGLKQTSSLPVLEKAITSPSRTIRMWTIKAYIAIAKEKNLPFLEKAVAESLKYPPVERSLERYMLYEYLYNCATNLNIAEEEMWKAPIWQFLVKGALTDPYIGVSAMVDKYLSVVPSYRFSTQRKGLARKWAEKEGSISSCTYFRNVMAEMEKAGETNLIDLKEKGLNVDLPIDKE